MKKCILLLCLTWVVGYSPSAYALNVSPIELFVDSGNDDLTTSLKLENKTDKSMPVELKQFRRLHQNGKENRVATDDFMIYPPQIILKPKSVQTVRLIWQGVDKKSKVIHEEVAYRILIKQVPLDLKVNETKKKKHQSALNILYEYVASVYVQPKKMNADMKIDVVTHNKANRKIEAHVKNVGNIHLLLSFYDFFAKAKGFSTLVKLTPHSDIAATNLLPGEVRKFEFAGAKELDNKKFEIVHRPKNNTNDKQ